ncbi:MAG: PAS domain S-box protein [Chlorobi bacterium]|nr:PAS domain S-box protein [Chlorobiota bacterium]
MKSNYENAVIENYRDSHKGNISADKSTYKTSLPIKFRNKNLGTLYIGYSLTELYAEIALMKRHIAIVSFVIFLIGIFIILVIERFITRPLVDMVRTVQQVAGGDLTIRAEIKTNDEVGFLAHSFNEMLDEIEKSNEELEVINNELEIRVRDRTAELADAIESLQKENKERKLIQKALRASEERFRGLFENSTIGIYRSTPEGRVLMANPTLIKMLGYSSLKEIQNIGNISEGYLNASARNRFKNLLKQNEKIFGFEEAWKRPDGSVIYIRESARSIRDEQGNIIYYEGSVEDITSKKIIEKELIEAKEKAEASLKLKSDFLAQMSHEIRTPVNSILSYTCLLKDELDGTIPEDLQFSFDMINNGGRRLIRTIDMILNMSELQTGTFEIKREEFNLVQDILNPLVGEFRSAVNSKNLDLIINKKLNTDDLIVNADTYSFTQTFANLIDNAIKYTNEGRIIINILQTEKGAAVEVEDTGIGISDDFIKSLFDPFTQEEQGYTRKFEGNGLGLALVKKYVELNGCQICVESEKDKIHYRNS